MSITKNCTYAGEVVAYGTEGEGIINAEGATAFVPFCICGEKVSFKALKVMRGGAVAYGKAEKILTPSPNRVEPVCPVFGKCGGCDLQHMAYSAQLEFKREAVRRALLKIGGIDCAVGDTVPCESPFRYRNKLALPIGIDQNGDTVVGFYARRSHRIVPVLDCAIQSVWIKDVISALLKYAKACGLKGYDELTRKGDLRRIVVREVQGKFIVALVAAHKVNVDFLAGELNKIFPEYTLLLNVNPSCGNAVFSKDMQVCRGRGRFEAEDCGIKYEAGAETFLQVNDGVRTKLYKAVLKEAEGADVAVDLYSGGGMLTAMLARAVNKAYGIEVVREASSCADALCVKNGLQGKMINICGRVEDKLDGVLAMAKGNKVVVCDPPRKGMERSVAEKLACCGADKIILISCDPATLARDMKILSVNYSAASVTPFDMFPQTRHVETLVVLSRKKPDGHIGVKVEFGEGEGQISLKEVEKRAEERKPKEKVTYKMIQEYIEKTYGFKVHTAYIAEVKRSLGLPMYDAPNAVEELKRPRSHPSPQMVEAIKETLKHFEII